MADSRMFSEFAFLGCLGAPGASPMVEVVAGWAQPLPATTLQKDEPRSGEESKERVRQRYLF